ncbi:MAG TPA: saccharopine dehydrogenase, partial [Bdellovibrionota bacterium]|nr:saccharopine dehydrogenase [Bdellovibrionota bacterium]
MTSPHIWLRAESKPKEERTALTPNDARRLLTAGFQVTVERSPLRAFEDEGYERVGCALAPTGSWLSKAPAEAFILGLKELPDADFELGHRHIYFAHVFKNQVGWQRTLKRFAAGGGVLLDLEYLTDSEGRRVSAFGHWAGFVGAGVGAGIWAHRKLHGDAEAIPALRSWPSQEQCVAELREQVE